MPKGPTTALEKELEIKLKVAPCICEWRQVATWEVAHLGLSRAQHRRIGVVIVFPTLEIMHEALMQVR